MKIVPLEGTALTLPELVEMARTEDVVLTQGGRAVATVHDVADSAVESAALASNPRFAAIMEESRRSHRESGGIGLDRIRAELGLESEG